MKVTLPVPILAQLHNLAQHTSMLPGHFYSSAEELVLKSLRSAVLLNPSLRLHPASRTVFTTDRSPHVQVAVISGGGAGHEPAHAGYTGRGMLAASVSGETFASPGPKQILNAIHLAAFGEDTSLSEKRDVLVIINNYPADRVNFGLAIEKTRALFPNVNTAAVLVPDDASLLSSPTAQVVCPRGLAGNILVCKLLGAFAEAGASLDQVKAYGDAVVSNLANTSVALEHFLVPGKEGEAAGAAPGEYKFGLGSPDGSNTSQRKLGDVRSLIREVVKMILEGDVNTGVTREDEDETVLFVNNLGGVSGLEMGALLWDLVAELDVLKTRPRRIYLSSFMTCFNTPGFSASLLNISGINRLLKPTKLTADTYGLLDTPTDAQAWLGVRRYWIDRLINPRAVEAEDTMDYPWKVAGVAEPSNILLLKLPLTIGDALRSACHAVLSVEEELTEYDIATGDGDCGQAFAAGARAVLSEMRKPGSTLLTLDSAALTERVAEILEDSMGGTIGALFGAYLSAYSGALRSVTSAAELKAAPSKALEALSHHTIAKPGDRTIIDALYPFCQVLVTSGNLEEAVKQSIRGANRTVGMKPKLWRALYAENPDAAFNTLDPGAWGVAKLLEGFALGLSSK